MITKESIYEQIAQAKETGATKTELGGKKKEVKNLVETFLGNFEQEGKIIRKGFRYYLKDLSLAPKKAGKKENEDIKAILRDYVKRDELEALLQDTYAKIAHLKEEIDRLYDYANDVFVEMKKAMPQTKGQLTKDDLRIIYDNLNAIGRFGDSIPLSVFKNEVMKKFEINEKQLNDMLLNLDDEGVIYLQTADKPDELKDKERGIQFQERLLYFLTWIKR